jgi:N-methylhydantoinase A/oxoprolinase/acetone carboxylase beta subunit
MRAGGSRHQWIESSASAPWRRHFITTIADGPASLAVRAVSVDRGIDPRDTALIAWRRRPPTPSPCARFRSLSDRSRCSEFLRLGMLMAQWRHNYAQQCWSGSWRIDAPKRRFRGLRSAGERRLRATFSRAAASISPPICAIAGGSTPSRSCRRRDDLTGDTTPRGRDSTSAPPSPWSRRA